MLSFSLYFARKSCSNWDILALLTREITSETTSWVTTQLIPKPSFLNHQPQITTWQQQKHPTNVRTFTQGVNTSQAPPVWCLRTRCTWRSWSRLRPRSLTQSCSFTVEHKVEQFDRSTSHEMNKTLTNDRIGLINQMAARDGLLTSLRTDMKSTLSTKYTLDDQHTSPTVSLIRRQ